METGSAVQNPNNIEKVLVQVISFEKMKEVMKNLGLKKDSSNFKEIFNKLEAHNLIRPEYLAMVLESAVKNPNTQITVYFNIWFGEKGKDVSEKLYNSHVNKIQEIFNRWLEKDLEGKVKNVSFKKVGELGGLEEGMGWRLSSATYKIKETETKLKEMYGDYLASFAQIIDLTKNIAISFHPADTFYVLDYDNVLNLDVQKKTLAINSPISCLNTKLSHDTSPDHSCMLIKKSGQLTALNVLKENNFYLDNNVIIINQIRALKEIINSCYEIVLNIPKLTKEEVIKNTLEMNKDKINSYISQGYSQEYTMNQFNRQTEIGYKYFSMQQNYIHYSSKNNIPTITEDELSFGESWHDTQDSITKLSQQKPNWLEKFSEVEKKFWEPSSSLDGILDSGIEYKDKHLYITLELIDFLIANKGRSSEEVVF